MAATGANVNGVALFLSKTYEMVDDSSTDSVVSWSDNGNSFVVWNIPEFARDMLPKYFKHNNFSSFVRKLNTYVEGLALLKHGFNDAIAKVGLVKFISDLFWVGMFYHLYNQVATNTLEKWHLSLTQLAMCLNVYL